MSFWDRLRGRKHATTEASGPAPAPRPVWDGGWRAVPALDGVIQRSSVAVGDGLRFRAGLASWQDHTFGTALGHLVGPGAPAGVMHGVVAQRVPESTQYSGGGPLLMALRPHDRELSPEPAEAASPPAVSAEAGARPVPLRPVGRPLTVAGVEVGPVRQLPRARSSPTRASSEPPSAHDAPQARQRPEPTAGTRSAPVLGEPLTAMPPSAVAPPDVPARPEPADAPVVQREQAGAAPEVTRRGPVAGLGAPIPAIPATAAPVGQPRSTPARHAGPPGTSVQRHIAGPDPRSTPPGERVAPPVHPQRREEQRATAVETASLLGTDRPVSHDIGMSSAMSTVDSSIGNRAGHTVPAGGERGVPPDLPAVSVGSPDRTVQRSPGVATAAGAVTAPLLGAGRPMSYAGDASGSMPEAVSDSRTAGGGTGHGGSAGRDRGARPDASAGASNRSERTVQRSMDDPSVTVPLLGAGRPMSQGADTSSSVSEVESSAVVARAVRPPFPEAPDLPAVPGDSPDRTVQRTASADPARSVTAPLVEPEPRERTALAGGVAPAKTRSVESAARDAAFAPIVVPVARTLPRGDQLRRSTSVAPVVQRSATSPRRVAETATRSTNEQGTGSSPRSDGLTTTPPLPVSAGATPLVTRSAAAPPTSVGGADGSSSVLPARAAPPPGGVSPPARPTATTSSSGKPVAAPVGRRAKRPPRDTVAPLLGDRPLTVRTGVTGPKPVQRAAAAKPVVRPRWGAAHPERSPAPTEHADRHASARQPATGGVVTQRSAVRPAPPRPKDGGPGADPAGPVAPPYPPVAMNPPPAASTSRAPSSVRHAGSGVPVVRWTAPSLPRAVQRQATGPVSSTVTGASGTAPVTVQAAPDERPRRVNVPEAATHHIESATAAKKPEKSDVDSGGLDLDDLARRLLEPVSRLLRAELRHGRERVGRLHDRRR